MKYFLFIFFLLHFSLNVPKEVFAIEKNNIFQTNFTVSQIDTCELPVFQQLVQMGAFYTKCSDLKVTLDNGYIITGSYNPISSANVYGFIVKLNKFGNIEWQKKISEDVLSNPWIIPRKIVTTQDSGFALVLTDGSSRNALLKFNKNGDLIWKKSYNFHGTSNLITDFITTSDDGFALCTGSSGGYTVSKLDGSGNVTWAQNYAVSDGVRNAKGILEFNNFLYLVGFAYQNFSTAEYNTLLKLNKSNGQIIWNKSFGPPLGQSEFRFNSISKSNNKLIVNGVFGVYQSSPKPGLFQFSEDGIVEKAVKIESVNNTISGYFDNVPVFTEDGTIGAHSLYGDTSDIFIYKLDNTNQIIWQWKYVMPGGQDVNVIRKTIDDGVIAAGADPSTGYDSVIYMIKTDNAGKTGGCDLQNPGLTTVNINIASSSMQLFIENTQVDTIPENFTLVYNSDFTIVKLCSANTECSNIKIEGEDTICNKISTYLYKISKDTGCHQNVMWELSDPALAQILNQTDSTIKLKYLKGGLLKLYAKLQFACSSILDSLTIHIFDNPDYLDIGPDINLCSNGFYDLNAHTGYKSYLWQNGFTDSIFRVNMAGTYFVRVTDYCDNIATDTVIAIAGPPEFLDIGIDTTICRKDTLTLTATPGFLSYNWLPDYNITNTAGSVTQVFPYLDTFYTIKATKRLGCTLLDSIKISIFPTPVIQLGNDTALCSRTSITLNAGAGFQNYLWNTGAVSQFLNVSQKNIYTVIATDINGCRSVDTLEILDIIPNPVIDLQKDMSICQGKSLTLDAGPGYKNYLWSTGETTNRIIINNEGLYWIRVSDKNGCYATENISVVSKNCQNLIYFPNSFTPNNDGVNDIFKPTLYGTLEKYELYIYNRYGQLVFYTKDLFNGWDGSFKNKIKNTGAFIWVSNYAFSGKSNETQTGSILLLK